MNWIPFYFLGTEKISTIFVLSILVANNCQPIFCEHESQLTMKMSFFRFSFLGAIDPGPSLQGY